MMFLYKFFDYKYNIHGFDSDLFSTWHILYIVLGALSVIVLACFAKKFNKDKFEIFLKVAAISIIVLEAFKISWESYYDITTGRGFNKDGLIPVYTCSLYMYCMLLNAFAKGKLKEYSLSFIATVSLVAGFVGMIYCNGLNYYPFWTFGAFYSMYFHYIMFATGVLVLATGYKKLDWSDIYKGWIPMVFLAFLAIPLNLEYGGDYMQLRVGGGVPLFNPLGKWMEAHHLTTLFSLIMLSAYLIVTSLVVSVYQLVMLLKNKIHHQEIKNEEVA